MITAITIIHLIACFFLILVVLLQTGKGAEMGAVFGGGSSATLFGASGAGNFLTKLTTGTAIVFFLTSLILAYSSIAKTQHTVFDQPIAAPPPLNAPAEKAPPAAAAEPNAAAPQAAPAPPAAPQAPSEPQAPAAPAPSGSAQ